MNAKEKRTIAEWFGTPMYATGPQMFGVEIEVEGAPGPVMWNLPIDPRGDIRWTVHDDGSLRNNGLEFVTPPVTMRQLRTLLEQYYTEAIPRGYRSTTRTGIHVHMNMRTRTLTQIETIVAAYCLVEPALFDMCGPEREECIYCVPLYRAHDEVEVVERAVRMTLGPRGTTDTLSDVLSQACKYSALYVEPLRRFGTIEFRNAPTWRRLDEMWNWVETLGTLVSEADKYGDVETLLGNLDENPGGVMASLLPKYDTARALGLMEDFDAERVASRLLRKRSSTTEPWVFPELRPLSRSGVYYPHAAPQRMERPQIRVRTGLGATMRFVNTDTVEEEDILGPDFDNDEEGG